MARKLLSSIDGKDIERDSKKIGLVRGIMALVKDGAGFKALYSREGVEDKQGIEEMKEELEGDIATAPVVFPGDK